MRSATERGGIAGNRLGLIMRAALLVAGLSTYLISPDDVVWGFIKTASNARLLEHILFGIAAAFLGLALLLRLKVDAHPENQNSRVAAAVASLLQAIGIGSLLPLPGFIMLVLGDAITSLVLPDKYLTAENPGNEEYARRAGRPSTPFRLRDALAAHIGLGFAFLSMVVFSVMLIDRVADVLFATTALVSLAANFRSFRRT